MRYLLILLLIPCLASAEENKYPIKITKVLDGDTIEASIDLGWDVTLSNKRIRCLDYDAWETSRRRQSKIITQDEINKGFVAKAAFEELLKKGKAFIRPGDELFDNYGRILAKVFIEQPDGKIIEVSKFMKENGHQRK